MTFRDFVASHTGRHFFESFREFVATFKVYVHQLTLQNQIVAAHQQALGQAFQAEVDAVDQGTPGNMPCMACSEVCSSETNILVGWRGAVSLLCVACAKEKGLTNDGAN